MSLMVGLVNEFKHIAIGLNSDTLIIIKLPDSRALRVISRSLFLAVIIFVLPSIPSILKLSSDISVYDSGSESDLTGSNSAPILFRDLAEEGLLRDGDKGLAVCSTVDDFSEELQFFLHNDFNVVLDSDLDRQCLTGNGTLDYVFASSFKAADFIDRVLKIGGIVLTLLSDDPSSSGLFQHRSNYKIVYLRQFGETVVAMRKIALSATSPIKKQGICGFSPQSKKTELNRGLEDAMLEPPRSGWSEHPTKLKKFLPDLLGDSLKDYRRRVFITDEKKGGAVKWFYKNYPTRNQHFEVFNLEMEEEPLLSATTSMSEWMMNNLRKIEDYVVMKAEARVVEEMLEDKTICWVDELLLECKHRKEEDEFEDNNNNNNGSSHRAYWQCLELYGRIRDEGIAVHQWWG